MIRRIVKYVKSIWRWCTAGFVKYRVVHTTVEFVFFGYVVYVLSQVYGYLDCLWTSLLTVVNSGADPVGVGRSCFT